MEKLEQMNTKQSPRERGSNRAADFERGVTLHIYFFLNAIRSVHSSNLPFVNSVILRCINGKYFIDDCLYHFHS